MGRARSVDLIHRPDFFAAHERARSGEHTEQPPALALVRAAENGEHWPKVMFRTAWIVVGLLGLPGLACGTSGGGSPMPGAGTTNGGSGGGGMAAGSTNEAGRATGGGGAGGGGAAGGASVLGDSPAEACLAYAIAVCGRRAECRGVDSDDCLEAGLRCPDLTASPGSTRTVAGLKACAETYKTVPCEQVEADFLPPCVTPGERAQGEPCLFASQCSTLSCKPGLDTECGKCARAVDVGESCAADDVDCAAGSYCSPEQTCVALTSDSAAVPPGPNEPCLATAPCVEDYYCPADSANPVCSALPTLGQSCESLTCASDSHCAENESAARVCTARPGLGEPCAFALNSPIEEPYICQKDLLCSYTSPMVGTCLPLPQQGEPCNIPPSNPSYGRCGDGLNCNFAVSPPLCSGPLALGEACQTNSACEPSLWCACPEIAPDCDTKVCVKLKLGGSLCGSDATAICHPAFDCNAGTCQPAELRGTFADACGG
jgi:hypothetical protein